MRRGAGGCHRYDFEAYTDASEKMYRVFLRYAPVVMAVSCDEAFLELAEGTDPMEAAKRVRRTITSPALFGSSICAPSDCFTMWFRF